MGFVVARGRMTRIADLALLRSEEQGCVLPMPPESAGFAAGHIHNRSTVVDLDEPLP